jgi:hypothetical protein
MDEQGVLRAGGCLELSESRSFESKHPAILPSHEETLEALIRKEHKLQLHAGINHTLAALRKKFFILGGRITIGRVQSVSSVRNASRGRGSRRWHHFRLVALMSVLPLRRQVWMYLHFSMLSMGEEQRRSVGCCFWRVWHVGPSTLWRWRTCQRAHASTQLHDFRLGDLGWGQFIVTMELIL